jgi:hypothetical protein
MPIRILAGQDFAKSRMAVSIGIRSLRETG